MEREGGRKGYMKSGEPLRVCTVDIHPFFDVFFHLFKVTQRRRGKKERCTIEYDTFRGFADG